MVKSNHVFLLSRVKQKLANNVVLLGQLFFEYHLVRLLDYGEVIAFALGITVNDHSIRDCLSTLIAYDRYVGKVFGKFNEYEFTGFIDMALRDKNGRDFVIDLKWSKAFYYEEPLNKGKALQLASYASMLRPDDFKVDCAYFLFQDKAFIENGEQNLRWREIWEQAERDARERFEQLSEGRVLLTEADDNDSNSPCKFCDFSGFCGKKRSDA